MTSISALSFTTKKMSVHLSDGQILSIPLTSYPKLAAAKSKQLRNFEISPSGYGIHWPDLDEDLSVHGFLRAAEKHRPYPEK